MKQSSHDRLVFIFPLLIAAFVFFAYVTYWTFQPIHEEFLSTVFDSQAKSFLSGTIDINPKDISFEAYFRNGKTYTYWGPFLPFMRIVLNFLAPEDYGRWSRISCWAAGVLAVWAFALIVWRELRRKLLPKQLLGPPQSYPHLTPPAEKRRVTGDRLAILLTLAMGLGTPIIWLMSSAVVYHEPILWGIAGSLWCLWYGLEILEMAESNQVLSGRRKTQLAGAMPRTGVYLGFSIWLGITLWSRATFAFPWIGAWALYLGWWIWTDWKNSAPRKRSKFWMGFLAQKSLWAFVVPTLVAGLFQIQLNIVKFGSPFKFFDRRTYNLCLHSNICTPDYDTFELARFPSALRAYYGLDARRYFSTNFPYARTNYPLVERKYFDGVEWTIPLTIASPWLFVLVPLGLSSLWRQRNRIERTAQWALTGLFLCQALLGLGVWWVVQRYISESLMLLIFLSLLGLRTLNLPGSKSISLKDKLFHRVLIAACVWSIFVSSASAWTWAVEINGVTPREFKESMKGKMLDMDWLIYRLTHRH